MTGISMARSRLLTARDGRDLVPIAAGLAALVGAMALLGAVNALVTRVAVFDVATELDRGVNFSVVVSGALLFAAAALIAALELPRAHSAWKLMAALFVYLGIDELFSIHEQLEIAVAIDWQLLYVPLAIAAAIGWLVLLRAMRAPLARRLWIGGAVAWGLSQTLEPLRYATGAPEVGNAGSLADALTGIEEVLEMSGSALFVLAVLAAAGWRWRAAQERHAEGGV